MPRLALIVLFTAVWRLAAAIHGPVRVESGLLSGIAGSNSEVTVFRGIPFAAPPLGDLRWRPPRPPAKWEGVRQAGQFSAACMQTPYAEGSLYRAAPEPVSEDCLCLNVWTAANSANERRPVMVWVHGGGLTRGSGSAPTYDGEELARKGVVLVTVNYRLGVFGFLAHPELTRESVHNSSGNYGFLDQIAALEWVHRNIARFGGDPNRVTIFGESAGSWSVNLLMATPLAKGLFQRAIGESGANFAPLQKLSATEQAGVKLAGAIGADSLAALRAKPPADILKAPGTSSGTVFLGNVDGWVLPEDIYAIFAAGRQNDVPVLIGSNADEGTPFAPPLVTAELFREQVKRRFGDRADAYLKLYPAGSDEEARASTAATIRDQTFGWEMRTWARIETRTGKSKVYLYYFSRVPPGPAGARYGAYHGSEISYVFHNLSRSNRPWEPVDRILSDTLSSYWVNFATTGDPNGQGLPKWPVYEEKADLVMELGNQIEPRPQPHRAALDFFDAWFANLRITLRGSTLPPNR
jgi:para-nitrobenzyl esterase